MRLALVPRLIAVALSLGLVALAALSDQATAAGNPWAALKAVGLYISALLGWAAAMVLLLRWDDTLAEPAPAAGVDDTP